MKKIAVSGGSGRVGSEVVKMLLETNKYTPIIIDIDRNYSLGNVEFVNNVIDLKEKPLAIIDFAPPAICLSNCKYAKENNIPFITGTTGFSDSEMRELENLSKEMKLFFAPNFSYGIYALNKILKIATQLLGEDYDIEIIEMHHSKKKDAPSGTAKKILNTILESYKDYKTIYGREGLTGERDRKEIAVHTLRGGEVTGDHKIIFAGKGERLEFTHKAESRRTFAVGVLKSLEFMLKVHNNGLYGMEDLEK